MPLWKLVRHLRSRINVPVNKRSRRDCGPGETFTFHLGKVLRDFDLCLMKRKLFTMLRRLFIRSKLCWDEPFDSSLNSDVDEFYLLTYVLKVDGADDRVSARESSQQLVLRI